MQVLLLGPVTVVDGDRATRLGSIRQAALLAALALRAGDPVSRWRLVEAVWGDQPPATARNTLQVHVSALRRLVGAGVVEAVGDAYRFAGTTEEVDVLRFRELVRQGLDAQAQRRHLEAARVLRSALALWRGDPFEGLTSAVDFFEADRGRLRRLRLVAELARLDADLALGRHLLLADELDLLAREHPFDEQVAARRILALHRSGRQAEALRAYAAVARLLRTELGVDPGPQLQRLHQQVLRHDPALDREPGPPTAVWRVPLDHSRGGLVGRDALLARLEARLAQGRVHTLVGPSGVGKTRLATELAARCQDRFSSGAALVSAAGLTSVEPLVDRLLDAVGGEGPLPEDREARRRLVAGAEALVILDDLAPTPSLRAELDALVAASQSTFVSTSSRPPGLAGEQISSVPPLDTGAAVELLRDRARSAGADIGDDEGSLRHASRCVDLLDGFPLAIELVAPLCVSGIPELAATLERRRARGADGDSLAVSFASSLDRLDPDEVELLDVLACAGGAVDAELLCPAGQDRALAALVRDGLVDRTPGAHGTSLYSVIGAVAAHRLSTRGAEVDRLARLKLVRALAGTVGSPGRYLPMMLPDPAQARRLVALEPALARAAADACELGLLAEAADIALVLPELHFARYGVAPPPGRFRQLADEPSIDAGRRADLLVSLGVGFQYGSQPEQSESAYNRALALARELDDPARLALVLAHRSISQLITAVDHGDTIAAQREAVRAAEASGRPDVLAGTLVLLYPTASTPPELADALPRAAAAARTAGHQGLLALALANLSFAELERGDIEPARVHAREAAALALDLHNRTLTGQMRAAVQTAEALAGTGNGLAAVAEVLDLAWERRELRTCTDALLKLAAGLHRQGADGDAARCLGVYETLLVCEGLAANDAERAFAGQWLGGLVPTPPTRHLGGVVPDLVRELTATRGSGDVARST